MTLSNMVNTSVHLGTGLMDLAASDNNSNNNISSFSTTTMVDTLVAAVAGGGGGAGARELPSQPANAEALAVVRFVVQRVCVPVVVGLGVIGNILNMMVLTRRSMMNSTNCYLTALAAFDTLYLIFTLTLSFQHYEGFDRDTVYVHWFPYGRVLSDMSANVSVLLTVTFTIERYIGVCHPMRGRVLCTPQRAKVMIALVAFLAVACTVPELFEMEVVWKTDDTSGNNETYPEWQYTDFSLTYSYQIGYYWFFVTIFTFLPLLLLCIFNGILVQSLFKAAELRTRMTFSSSAASSSSYSSPQRTADRYSREQRWITKMLVTVVLVFILCQMPGAVLVLIVAHNELTKVRLSGYGRNQLRIAGNITNLLIQINASINFILYSMTSSKFRRVFCKTLCLTKEKMAVGFSRTSTFRNEIPLTSYFSGSARNSTMHANQSVRSERHHPHLRLLMKPPASSGQNGKVAKAHAWNGQSDNGGLSPATETCYTDSEKEV